VNIIYYFDKCDADEEFEVKEYIWWSVQILHVYKFIWRIQTWTFVRNP